MTAICKADGQFVEADVDDERVLMSVEGGEFFALAGTGLAFWNAIDGARDLDAIIALLAEQHGTETTRISEDCEAFLAQLCDAGFVES